MVIYNVRWITLSLLNIQSKENCHPYCICGWHYFIKRSYGGDKQTQEFTSQRIWNQRIWNLRYFLGMEIIWSNAGILVSAKICCASSERNWNAWMQVNRHFRGLNNQTRNQKGLKICGQNHILIPHKTWHFLLG